MASSLQLPLLLFVLLHALLFLFNPIHSHDDEEDNLLQGINSYRQSLNLPPLTKNDKAGCLADEIAGRLEDQRCATITTTTSPTTVSGPQLQIDNYPDLLKKCNIDPNTTRDGVILAVCVPKLVPTLVLTNYTQSKYSGYLNNSKYTGAGLGSEDDWMVVVLSTNTPTGISPTGSFVSAADLVSRVCLSHYLMFLLFLVMLN